MTSDLAHEFWDDILHESLFLCFASLNEITEEVLEITSTTEESTSILWGLPTARVVSKVVPQSGANRSLETNWLTGPADGLQLTTEEQQQTLISLVHLEDQSV